MISISFSEAYAQLGNKIYKFKTLLIREEKNIFLKSRSDENR